jgi:NhaP-type Na+/H+ or K+/H+ antiporter
MYVQSEFHTRTVLRHIHQISFFGIVGTLVNFLAVAGLAHFFSTQGWIICSSQGDDCQTRISFLEAMLLGAVLSASDEVAAMALVRPAQYPKLAALIFGEGVTNDALAIVLFKALLSNYKSTETTLEKLPAQVLLQVVGALGIGVGIGLANALLLKRMNSLGQHPARQTALVLGFGYVAYGIAEFADISGILTIFFCGITMAHYR